MKLDRSSPAVPHLIWLTTGPLDKTLYAAQWLDTTRELRELGWRVTLVGTGPSGVQVIQGVEVLYMPMPQIYLLRQLLFHRRFLGYLFKQWNNVDVVLFHQMSAPWLLPLRLARSLTGQRCPLLVMDTRTVIMEPLDKETWRVFLRRMFDGLIHSAANRWCDGQTAITQRMAQAVHIPVDKLWGVWPSGVNLHQFTIAQKDRHWPMAGEPIQLIYVGTLHYERNLLTFCQAVERANAEGLPIRFTIIGKGTQQIELAKFASQTAGRICVLPPVPHEQIPTFLAQAHVGVLPFPDEEKFQVSSPIKLFEYMAAGLPILATRIACHTDVVDGGTYVFWAEDASVEGLLTALRQTWQARAAFSEMGREAAKAVEAWTWQEAARKLKAALEDGLLKASARQVQFAPND